MSIIEEVLSLLRDPKLVELSDEDLLHLHGRLHAFWRRAQEKGENFNLEDLVNAHAFVFAELARRDLKHKEQDDLDRESAKLAVERVYSISRDAEFEKAIAATAFEATGFLPHSQPGVQVPKAYLEALLEHKPKYFHFPKRINLVPFIGTPMYLISNGQAYGEIIIEEKLEGEAENEHFGEKVSTYRYRFQRIYDAPREVKSDPRSDLIPNVIFKRIDGESFLETTESIEELVLIPDFVSLTGTSVSEPERAQDLDILIRADEVEDKLQLDLTTCLMKLARAYPQEFQEKFHFIFHPAGPAWSYIPLFDLVLRRKKSLQPVDLEESYAYYKQKVAPIELFKPFTPIKSKSGYHKGEWFVGEEDELWETWARGYAKNGGVIVEPKYDGIRLIIHRDDDRFAIYTEDRHRDRVNVFPTVVEAFRRGKYPKRFIIDTEFVIWKEGNPIPREEMMELVVGKEPIVNQEIVINIHDLLYVDGPVNDQPYLERIQAVHAQFPRSEYKNIQIVPSVYWEVKNRKEFDAALKKAYAYPGSEGAMLKWSRSLYDPRAQRVPDWAKIKKVKEIDFQIIGIHKKALPWASIGMKAPKEPITGEEAVKLYKRLSEKSNTYQFRVALKDGKKLVPMEAKDALTPSDVTLKWNPNLVRPKWQGTDAPEVWEMDERFPHRKPGELAYAVTYAKNFDIKPELGMIVNVSPAQIVKFRRDGQVHYSWMFPKPRELKPDETVPDDLKDIQRFIREEK